LDAIPESWIKAAETLPADRWGEKSAEELAVEFCRVLYAHPEFIGLRIDSELVRKLYPVFCRSLGTYPRRYEDFAKELARLLPR
jgi:hypothetical protein